MERNFFTLRRGQSYSFVGTCVCVRTYGWVSIQSALLEVWVIRHKVLKGYLQVQKNGVSEDIKWTVAVMTWDVVKLGRVE